MTIVRLAAAVLALTAGLAPAGVAVGEPEPESRAVIGFDVIRKGDVIGIHEIAFSREENRLVVDIAIDIEVSFLFFTAYSYTHRAREVWQGDRLVRLQSETDDNGKILRVDAEAAGDGMRIRDATGEEQLVKGELLATTYWNSATLQAERLLNTQTGEVMDVRIEARGNPEELPSPWGPILAQEYRVITEESWSLWYDPAGCLAGIEFTVRSESPIRYRMTDYPIAESHPWIAETPLLERYAGCTITSQRQAAQSTEAGGKTEETER